jgi:hypothetical protein
MRDCVREFVAARCLGALAIFLAAVAHSSCVKKGGEAIVMGKEHVESVEIVEAADNSSADGVSSTPAPSPGQGSPARMTEEQWIVSVQMVADRRWIDVPVDEARWEKLKEGDRVKVTYREGKYTGTAWAAEIR